MNKLIPLIILLILLKDINTYAQQDFNFYKTLKSSGQIPIDFSSLTYQKIKKDLKKGKENLSRSEEKIFIYGTNYGIDEILHSGLVVYGDEVSTYVQSIANKLLENEPTLQGKLRFYTLKSNESNAFSTDQGMVFVTTGLISQLTNEAQLALILAHEISHFTENHVVNTFKNVKSRNLKNTTEFSTYSKENEFDADKNGLKWYHKAGYSKDLILETFDIILYAYLPFDEKKFPITYFNTKQITVNEEAYPKEESPITAIEDYNDELSSHPNIKKRKENISKEMEKFSNWGNDAFMFGEEKFNYIRNVCRFESVRTDVLNAKYASAIYSIFLLEEEFPESLYLKKLKAQALLGLVHFKIKGNYQKTYTNANDIEGESAAIHFLISKCSKDEISIFALRYISDLKQEFPDDAQICSLFNYLIKNLASDQHFNLDKFSTSNYETYLKNEVQQPIIDTLKKESKYDKIKNKKTVISFEQNDNIVIKDCYFSIPDIVSNKEIIDLFIAFKNELKENKAEEKKDTQKAKKHNDLNELYCGLDKIILVEPMVFSTRKQEIDLIESEKLKHDFSDVIEVASKASKLEVITIDRDCFEEKGTDAFNERNVLLTYMSQVSEENNTVFPIDFDDLKIIEKKYNTSKVMFTWVSHEFDPDIAFKIMGGIILYPILPVLVPIVLLNRNQTNINIILLDLDTGNNDIHTQYSFNDKPKKHNLGARIYDIFDRIKTKQIK